MVQGYWLHFGNSSGILDSKFVRHEEQLIGAMQYMMDDLVELHEGDRFWVEAGECEEE